ncbi:hypothetical protein, partial [Pseudomonas sp.]|uniref:hypothetical protein n=1 Tax=Pseudomonas sp. TaxID=306 RepID=UPI003262EABD
GSKRLLLLSALLDLPEVTTQVKLLDETIADLRHLPQSASDIRDSLPPYSSWIPQIIDQQDRLLTLLSEQYARQPAISEMQQELHGLSQDVGRLSVAYQLDAFTYLVAQQWMLDREAVIKLDASILQRFSDLSAREPALSVTLGKMLGRYNFVRGYLLKPDKGWAPSAVERYLMSVANDIDNTASTLKP